MLRTNEPARRASSNSSPESSHRRESQRTVHPESTGRGGVLSEVRLGGGAQRGLWDRSWSSRPREQDLGHLPVFPRFALLKRDVSWALLS